MKLYKYLMLPVLAALAFTACEEEENGPSKAIIPGSSEIVLPAAATSQNVTIYADGTWVADVTDTWLSIDPTSGKGTMDVVLTADANVTDLAREAKIIVKGASTLNDIEITVTQKMDRFRTMDACTVTEAVAKQEGDLVKLSECQVAAVGKKGFVVTDGRSNIYVEGNYDKMKAGDKLTLTGDVVMVNGLLAIKLDDAFFSVSGEMTYPQPKDVTSEEAYAPGKVEYVKLSATYASGGKIQVDGKQVAAVYEPANDLSSLDKHNVVFTGYYVGVASNVNAILVVSTEDLGRAPIVGKDLPYKDDFSWLAPFIEQSNAVLAAKNRISDCVGSVTSSADGCANIYTTLVNNNILLLDELRSRGYTDLNPSMKTIYLQDQYLKYGATAKTSGLVLPNFKIDGTMDLFVSFKWCSQMQGSGTIDDTQMVIEIVSGPGAVVTASGEGKVSDPVPHSQGTGEMFWQDAMFKVVGATSETLIAYHPAQEPASGSLFRYYLDDLEVVSAEGMVEANIEVGGISNDLVTFEGTPAGPVVFTVKSDSDFSISSTANWLHLDETEGIAGEEKTITLTCDVSELSTLRQAEISIKSGLSTRKIQVVQSAAGQSLSPFISIVGGNELTVKGEAAEKTVTVQANVPYEIEVVEGAEWIAAAKVETKALVQMTDIVLTISENKGSDPRTGVVRVYNEANKLSAYLTVVQEQSTVILARWFLDTTTMDGYKDTFGTTTGTLDKAAGDGGQYIDANDGGSGRITYVQVDKTDIDVDGKSGRWTGGTGEPYVVGAWKGDYWLITAHYDKGIPPGANIHGFFSTRTSGSGLKYWLAEYLDGTEWKPLMETQKVTSEGAEVEYNIAHANTANFKVEFSYQAVNASNDVKIRVTAVALDQANGGAALAKPNGGTIRIKGNDGLSPYIEMSL
ncbi:MAG: BACON domain-containing protein [Candidatus Cryptobacteroides sp.]